MIFTSPIFLFLFLPIITALYFISPKKIKNLILLLASLFFYAWGETQYIYVILASILLNYWVAIKIERYNGLREIDRLIKQRGVKSFLSAKLILGIGVVLNILLLGYFKYANFFIINLNLVLSNWGFTTLSNPRIHFPLGISFFTFQVISYIVDVYRKEIKAQKNLLNVALYVSLFPKIMAGPIVRYKDIVEEIENRSHSLSEVAEGLRRFICGLGKKMLIANPLGDIANLVFGLEHSELNPAVAWIGIICYTFQIFFDFAGYTDMAIGLARIFGFKFSENFDFPYISKSIQEFWRRWHMTLSNWIKDYLYIPMGGNREGILKTYRNLLVSFLLCGLWHGAAWNFVIWGAYQGFFLIIERIRLGKILEKAPKFIGHFYMLFVTIIGWVFFRATSMGQAGAYLVSMFNFSKPSTIFADLYIAINNFSYIAFVFAILLSTPFARWSKEKLSKKVTCGYGFGLFIKDLWLILIMFLSIVRISASTFNPFIYFQF
jgi:alginate O-acetyltransferase complex protein AlgI